MFDILDRPLHWLPVKWPGLLQSEDENALSTPIEHEIELRFELVDREEAQKLFPRMFGDKTSPVLEELTIFKRVVKDWRKIKMGGRVPKFENKNIKILLSVPLFATAFASTYIAALGGRTAIREEKSDGLPPGGQADAQTTGTTTNLPETADVSE